MPGKVFPVTAQQMENENFITCASLIADHAHHSNGKALQHVNH
jgi:hypothetical protein